MNTMIKTVLSLCVVFTILGAGMVPVINAINQETEVVTETITYGDNPLDSYTEIIASSQRGDVSAKYTVERGDFTASTSTFTPNATGDYIKVASAAAEALTFYAEKVDAGMYVGAGSSTMAAELAQYTYPYQLTYQGQIWKLALNSSNNQIVEVTVDDATDGAYAILPYDVRYDVPTQTVYADNTIQTSTVSSVVGTMSGTTFTADPNGDYLSIPLYVLNNGTGTYKVEDGATIYAPDTTGSLAAFTITSGAVSGLNNAITMTLTPDTTITSTTAYTMTVSSTDTDLPDVVIPKSIIANSVTPVVNAAKISSSGERGSAYMLTTSGDLYASGENGGVYGDGSTAASSTWVKVATNVKDMGMGGYYGAYLSNSGQLYYSSTNSSSHVWELVSDNVDKIYVPKFGTGEVIYFIDTADNAKRFNGSTTTTLWSDAAEVIHNNNSFRNQYMVLTNDGALYSSGGVQLATGVVSAAMCRVGEYSDNMFYLDSSGDLYVKGDNKYGSLGIAESTASDWTLTASNVAKFWIYGETGIASANGSRSYYLSTSGDLYAVGLNLNSSLGDGTGTAQTSWTLLSSVSDCKDMVVNPSNTFVIDDSNVLFGVGRNNMGNLGIGNLNSPISTWTQAATGVSNVFCATNTTFYVDSQGNLYGTGSNLVGGGTTGYGNIFVPQSAQAMTVIYSNSIENITITDVRGSISGTTFTPSASGDMLQIPLRNLAQYTYYIGDGATYYAPDASDALTAFAAPTTTGVNSAISLTFTDMGATYYNTLNSMTASVTDTDLKALVIPFTATYMAPVSTHYTYNFTGSSQDYVFTESATGEFIKIPGVVLEANTYYADSGASYYALNASSELAAFTVPNTTGVTGISLTFTADTINGVYALNGEGEGYVIIPRVYDTNRTNPVDVLEYTFTPVRGNVQNGTFTESVTGSYVKVFAPNLSHATYRIGNERVYYVAENDTVEATKTVPDTAGIPGASLTLTADADNEGFYILTGTTENNDTAVLIPYTASYDKTETIVTERIPLLNTIPLVIILVGVVSVTGLLIRREY